MDETIARYLENDAEPETALAEVLEGSFGHAIEVPAYAETDSLFETLASVPEGPQGDVLIVVVLNARADSPAEVHEANRVARETIAAVAPVSVVSETPDVRLFPHRRGRLLLIDRALPGDYLPAGQGIGLARKIGCDLMLRLHAEGRLVSPWIHATDADVTLPNDYFGQIGDVDSAVRSAALYFFEHRFPEEDLAEAGRLLEISFRYATLGLAWAGSPYAYESLGSCLAITPWAYAAVGGFPRRDSIEDFTIANDLAKIGSIERLAGSPIELSGRISTRVPVSTGQTLSRLVGGKRGAAADFELHHPIVFAHLAAWLRVLGAIARRGGDLEEPLKELPHANPFFRADLLEEVLGQMGAFEKVREAIAEPGDEETLLRRLHAGFDAFSTRRLLDDLRDAGLPSIGFRDALSEAPFTGLTASTEDEIETLRLLLAEEEKRLSVVPAGIPSVELDRA
jgi:hypothetical protein